MNKHRRNVRSMAVHGFTIVELLIVVVVIAILAAITIVAYNGITRSAREASLQSSVQTAAKKIVNFKTETSEYPATLSAIGIVDDEGKTHGYWQKNGWWCVSVTKDGMRYRVLDNVSTPQDGVCGSAPQVQVVQGTSCGTSCYRIGVRTNNFRAGSYQVRCYYNGVAGTWQSMSLLALGEVMTTCNSTAGTGPFAIEIEGWGMSTTATW